MLPHMPALFDCEADLEKEGSERSAAVRVPTTHLIRGFCLYLPVAVENLLRFQDFVGQRKHALRCQVFQGPDSCSRNRIPFNQFLNLATIPPQMLVEKSVRSVALFRGTK